MEETIQPTPNDCNSNVEFTVNGEVIDPKPANEEAPVQPTPQEGESLPTTPASGEEGSEPEAAPAEEGTETAAEKAPEEPALSLAALEEAVKGLQKRFDEKIAFDEYKNQLFDKLYSELQLYKQDLHAKLVEPIVKDVIKLLSETQKFCDQIDKRSPEDVREYLQGIPEDLVTMLEDHDVELYRDTDSETFNPRTQRVLRIVPTDDAALEKKIAQRVRPGYRWKGKTLQPEMVNIYKYNKQ